jgi:(p)ppGpp synthase/HD superfamily hydrolase
MAPQHPICEHRRVLPPDANVAAFLAPLPISSRAAAWAQAAHKGQKRDLDGAPFMLHPYEVAMLLHVSGYGDAVLAIGLLHDVAESGGATLTDIAEAFGPRIAADVAALTENDAIADYHERKAALRASAGASSEEVLAVFAADKVVKARDLRIAAGTDRLPTREVAAKREHYEACLEVLDRQLPDHPLTDALRFELAAHLAVPALAWLRAEPAPAPVTS